MFTQSRDASPEPNSTHYRLFRHLGEKTSGEKKETKLADGYVRKTRLTALPIR